MLSYLSIFTIRMITALTWNSRYYWNSAVAFFRMLSYHLTDHQDLKHQFYTGTLLMLFGYSYSSQYTGGEANINTLYLYPLADFIKEKMLRFTSFLFFVFSLRKHEYLKNFFRQLLYKILEKKKWRIVLDITII